MFGTTRIATAAVAAVLSLAVTGAGALAAFQPAADTATLAASETAGATALHAEKDRERDGEERTDGLRAILARLVASGTITQAQADAILSALVEAAKDKKDKEKDKRGDREAGALVKRVLGEMLKMSVAYIGLPHEAVAGQLKAGKSLAEIADAQPGKSRAGLIAHLETEVTAKLDALVADGKITQERADQAKAHLTENVTRFVDHKVERKPAKERKERKPAASPTPKPPTG